MPKIDYAKIDKIRMEENSPQGMSVLAPSAAGAQTLEMSAATIFVDTFPSPASGKVYLKSKLVSGTAKMFIVRSDGQEANLIDDDYDPQILIFSGW